MLNIKIKQFEKFNIKLLFGIPKGTFDEVRNTVRSIIKFSNFAESIKLLSKKYQIQKMEVFYQLKFN